ncbi:MAG TPA: trypsin-like peptidase domain-containing protein [Ilumatobacter sp.]|nr:trypsin-like peptidase domain-containing protein [Ilumatobacter sp.]
MTDLMASSHAPAEVPADPPPHFPAPEAPPPTPASSPNEQPRRGRPRWRFAGGVVTGVIVSALVAGSAVLIDDDSDSAPGAADGDAAAAPVESDDSGASSVTAVPAGSSVHDLVVAVRPAIVAIHTRVTETDVFGQEIQGEAAGSGFVLSADGYVVTNNHVVEGASDITVTFDDGSTEEAELVGADPRADLAVLHVDRTDLEPLALGDSDAIRVGDPVVAIGNALDLGAEPTVTGGLISAKDRTITDPNGSVLADLIQTDAAISPGNSGGPLLDMTGQVVGINTAVAGQGQNIGFAIAINRANDLIEQLRNGETPQHALLGVTTRANPDGSAGAVVVSLQAGAAADEAGIRERDVITELDGESVDGPEDLAALIAGHQPGDEVTVEFQRDGESQTLDVTLGAHDAANS